MKIPNTVKIGGHTVIVSSRDHMARDDNRLGESCGTGNYINIDRSAPESTMASTFLHEIIEQLNWQLELNLEHCKISQLEAGLYQVLHDNKLQF